MMRKLAKSFELYALLWGLGALAIALVFLKRADVIGVAVGTILALANWFAFNWAGRRVAAVATKNRLMAFLAIKTPLLLGAMWLILSSGVASALGLLLGFSSLVFGIIVRSSVQVLAEGDAALREER